MWADVLDAHTPNAAEMAAAEAELQALGEVPPLPAADVEALVELAVKTSSVESRGVVGTILRSRRFRQPLLQAAAAVLLLMAVAWVARKLVLPKERDTPFILDYAAAVELATQPGRVDGAYSSALGLIVTECGKAAETLHSLAEQVEYPVLAKKARLISAELAALLTNGPNAPSGPIDRSLIESANTAADPRLPVDVREKALDYVRDLAKSGITAMWLAPLASDAAKAHRETRISRLLRALPR